LSKVSSNENIMLV